jgi:hypothetical protein
MCLQAGDRAEGTAALSAGGSKYTSGAHHRVVRFVICCIAAMGSSVIAWALEAAESVLSAEPKGRATASYWAVSSSVACPA